MVRTDKWLLIMPNQFINNMTNLSEKLPATNDTTNLNKRLPVIDNINAKMTHKSMICNQWPVWLMIYVVDNLCGHHLTLYILGRIGRLIDYEKQEG